MALRLIELYFPDNDEQELKQWLDQAKADEQHLHYWSDSVGSQCRYKVLVDLTRAAAVVDELRKRWQERDDVRILQLPVESAYPHPNPPGESEDASSRHNPAISREELVESVAQSLGSTSVLLTLVLISSLAAAIGLLRDNTIVVIGAMVIAPVLAPNAALGVGVTLANFKLLKRSALALLQVILLSATAGVVVGYFLRGEFAAYDPPFSTYAGLHWQDLALALLAGAAAILSYTTNLLSSLVGVTLAVAFLPQLVAFGLLLGAGEWTAARGALLVFVANMVCINLSIVLTLLARGIRPTGYDEEQKARHSTRLAILIWTLLLLVLIGILWIA